jgi:tetratricopeptide (TPR) repeat protein
VQGSPETRFFDVTKPAKAMIDETNKNEAIEKYLLGELTGEQLAAFREKLAADAGFRKEVALEQAIVRNLKTVGRADLRQKLEGFHQEMEPVWEADEPEAAAAPLPPQPVSRPQPVIQLKIKRHILLAAASLALVLAVTLTLRSIRQTQNTPEAIFESYYEPYDEIAVMRDVPTKTAIKNEAAMAYNERNYRRSIQLFRIVLEKEKDEEALFYLGNSYLSANMPLEAIDTFEAYLKDFDTYEIEAKWYLSLSYLKAGKDQKARKLLQELAQTQGPENPYRDKAAEILSRFEQED